MSEESCGWEIDFKFRWCYVMCHSLQYELGEGKDLVLQCAIPSLWRHIPVSLVLLPILTAGVRGESRWGMWPFFPRLGMSISLDSDHSKVYEFAASEWHPQCFYFCQILEVWFGLLQLPDGPMAQGFDFTQPIAVPSHALLHCVFAVFISLLFPLMGRGRFPNHEDDFGDEWSCVNCKKHRRVSSTAVCVFPKAFFLLLWYNSCPCSSLLVG